ncbi:hypothetical protein HanIR_Chr08g0360061 [Helianthus annuus]|nr:hypothetical protein HanIR_Chr08g0360061 [Helianthus annuus]
MHSGPHVLCDPNDLVRSGWPCVTQLGCVIHTTLGPYVLCDWAKMCDPAFVRLGFGSMTGTAQAVVRLGPCCATKTCATQT